MALPVPPPNLTLNSATTSSAASQSEFDNGGFVVNFPAKGPQVPQWAWAVAAVVAVLWAASKFKR